jgi:hypothetical protein
LALLALFTTTSSTSVVSSTAAASSPVGVAVTSGNQQDSGCNSDSDLSTISPLQGEEVAATAYDKETSITNTMGTTETAAVVGSPSD